MIQRLTVSDFRDAFRFMDRKDQFSYAALGLLYDYLEELDSEWELDVIGLCCEFNEMSIADVIREYSVGVPADADEAAKETAVLDYLNNQTSVVGQPDADTVLFAAF